MFMQYYPRILSWWSPNWWGHYSRWWVGEVGWEGIEVSLDQPQWLEGDRVWALSRGAHGGIRSD